MIYAFIGITVLWLFLFCYIIIASIDFGAGFFALHSKLTGDEKKINHLISRYLNPVWEVTNVFFVFFFVGFVGFFPESIKYLGTVLLIPGSIALIMISLRNSFYAFENYGQDTKLAWMIMYGVSGLLIPASLSTALTITEGGYINVRNNVIDLDWVQLLLSPFAWSVVFLAIISVLYISSGFLTYYAKKANDEPAYNLTRQWHIFLGPPMIIICLFVFLSLRIQNSEHFYSAVFDYWWMFGISFLFFALASLLTFFKKKHGLAFVFVILQMMFAFFGYGISKLPYLLYPFVKITDAYV
ncbi:TPA: cytochrome d ubiquinol oxidase subunit II, partial [Staphylococcus aureus]